MEKSIKIKKLVWLDKLFSFFISFAIIISVYIYELKTLSETCEYYDFKVWVEDDSKSISKPQGSVFKISIDYQTSMLDFHKTVCRYLFPDKRNSKFDNFKSQTVATKDFDYFFKEKTQHR